MAIREALTFDDVLLVPAASNVLPGQVAGGHACPDCVPSWHTPDALIRCSTIGPTPDCRSPARVKSAGPHSPPGHSVSVLHDAPGFEPPTHVAITQVPEGQSPLVAHGRPLFEPPEQAFRSGPRRAMRRMV